MMQRKSDRNARSPKQVVIIFISCITVDFLFGLVFVMFHFVGSGRLRRVFCTTPEAKTSR